MCTFASRHHSSSRPTELVRGASGEVTMAKLESRTRKRSKARPVLLLLSLCALVLYLLSLHKPRRKRCTPTSTEPYCPQPLACTESRTSSEPPRPVVVISAGGQRAASTFLYNALRILLRIRDPNTVSGWYADLKRVYKNYAQVMPNNGNVTDIKDGDRLQAFRSVGSLLVKIHTVRDWHDFLGGGDVDAAMEGVVDGVFTSHRDLRDMARSIRDMGWGTDFTAAQMAEDSFCRQKVTSGRKLRFFRREEYARENTWVTVARTQIRCREVLLETAGQALKLDLKAEDAMGLEKQESLSLLKEISKELDYEYSEAELDVAASELSRLRAGKCSVGYDVEMTLNPVTHLHKGHVKRGDTDGAETQRGMKAIEKDAVGRRWLQQHMYDVA